MDDYKIVKLKKEHINYVSEIMQKRWELELNEAYTEASKYIAHNEKFAGWIVLFGNKPVGVGLFDHKNEDVSKKFGPWLMLLYVEPEHRGHGLGIKLTQKRMAHARKHKYKLVHLDTTDAHSYHLKKGWEKIDEVDYHGEQDAIMKYDLTKKFPK